MMNPISVRFCIPCPVHSEEAKLLHAKCFVLHDIFIMWLFQRFTIGILQAYDFYQLDAEEM